MRVLRTAIARTAARAEKPWRRVFRARLLKGPRGAHLGSLLPRQGLLPRIRESKDKLALTQKGHHSALGDVEATVELGCADTSSLQTAGDILCCPVQCRQRHQCVRDSHDRYNYSTPAPERA